eukprot:4605027-Prymnesium_polylepis.1
MGVCPPRVGNTTCALYWRGVDRWLRAREPRAARPSCSMLACEGAWWGGGRGHWCQCAVACDGGTGADLDYRVRVREIP